MQFLTRTGCHLCEDALPVARRVASITRTRMSEVDIDADDELVVEFGLRIPVVRWSDGTVLAEGVVELKPLLAAAIRKRLGTGRAEASPGDR
jgi:hypothetical protein